MSYSAPVHTYNKECTYICNVVLGAKYRPLSVYDSVSYNTTNSTKYRELSYETEGRSVTWWQRTGSWIYERKSTSKDSLRSIRAVFAREFDRLRSRVVGDRSATNDDNVRQQIRGSRQVRRRRGRQRDANDTESTATAPTVNRKESWQSTAERRRLQKSTKNTRYVIIEYYYWRTVRVIVCVKQYWTACYLTYSDWVCIVIIVAYIYKRDDNVVV